MPDQDSFYAPKPEKIKSVVVVEENGTAATYSDLLAAVTAVYRLSPVESIGLASVLNHVEGRTQ